MTVVKVNFGGHRVLPTWNILGTTEKLVCTMGSEMEADTKVWTRAMKALFLMKIKLWPIEETGSSHHSILHP